MRAARLNLYLGTSTLILTLASGCALPLEGDSVASMTEGLRGSSSPHDEPDGFAINPADPTSDDVENVILHSLLSCTQACIQQLDTHTRRCQEREHSQSNRARCEATALSTYDDCVRGCPAEDYPMP